MRRIGNWFRLRNLEKEFDRELSHHLDCRVSELVRSGLSETEARRQAALDLGGVTQVREEVRDGWLIRWLRDFVYDQPPRQSAIVVLSYHFWKSQLAGAADVVGRKVWINRRPMTVIGVAAPEFHGIDIGEVPSVWIPAPMSTEAIPGFTNMLNPRVRWMQVLARLRPDVALAQAQSGLQPWFKSRLEQDIRSAEFPKVAPERRQRFLASTLQLAPAPQGHAPLRRRLSQPLWVLFTATADRRPTL